MKETFRKIIFYYKDLPKNEWKELRKNVSVVEYILWWQVRVMMIFATLMVAKEYHATGERFDILIQLIANTVAAFSVTLLRVIFPKQIFLGRVPYSAMKYGMVIILLGSYCGHYLGWCGKPGYDSFLHILSGFLCVFICYEIVIYGMQLNPMPVSGFIASVIGFGMGCFVIICWEMFEFTYDYFVGTNLQDFLFSPEEDYIMFELIGRPKDERQFPVFDTMVDMMLALASSVPASAILWAWVAHKNKKLSASPQIELQEAMKNAPH